MGESHALSLSLHSAITNTFILQITKWDEQREEGTFPASLEP